MGKHLAITIIVGMTAASAGEAPFRLGLTAVLLGANDEVGGVDEVDTYPSGLPQVEPEVVSPPLRPGQPPALPAQPPPGYRPPGYQPPGYQPPVLQPVKPPPRRGRWRYRTTLSTEHGFKRLFDWETERDVFDLTLHFKKAGWDGRLPFDHFEGRNGVGYIAIGGTPPDMGRFWDAFGSGDVDGPRLGAKLYLADGLSVEGYAVALFFEDAFGSFDENLFGVKASLHLGDGLTLWYAREQYDIGTDWIAPWWEDWQYEWDVYGLDLLFRAGRGHFKIGVLFRQDPVRDHYLHLAPTPAGYGFMGPIENGRLDLSWFPSRQLKFSMRFNKCPNDMDDSVCFSAKWDLASWLSLSYYRQQSLADSRLEADAACVVLRF